MGEAVRLDLRALRIDGMSRAAEGCGVLGREGQNASQTPEVFAQFTRVCVEGREAAKRSNSGTLVADDSLR